MPCLERFGLLCICQYNAVGVLVKAIMRQTVPQGYNPRILFLTLVLVQEPGDWPQVMTWLGVRYDEIVREKPYDSVTIFGGEGILGSADVEEVH